MTHVKLLPLPRNTWNPQFANKWLIVNKFICIESIYLCAKNKLKLV